MIYTVIKEKVQLLYTERNKYVLKRDLDDDSDAAHLTSFGKCSSRQKTQKNELSPSAALLCAGLLRRGMAHGLERVLRVRDGFFSSMSAIYDGAVLL